MIDYKAALCQIIEDLGGEIAINKDALKSHHILHWYEDEQTVTLIAEEK